jgi:hypothetical protein
MLKSVSIILGKLRTRKLKKVNLTGKITSVEKSSVEKPDKIAHAVSDYSKVSHVVYISQVKEDGTCPVCEEKHSP